MEQQPSSTRQKIKPKHKKRQEMPQGLLTPSTSSVPVFFDLFELNPCNEALTNQDCEPLRNIITVLLLLAITGTSWGEDDYRCLVQTQGIWKDAETNQTMEIRLLLSSRQMWLYFPMELTHIAHQDGVMTARLLNKESQMPMGNVSFNSDSYAISGAFKFYQGSVIDSDFDGLCYKLSKQR